MTLFDRHLSGRLAHKIQRNGILAVIGARQSGKTTLIRTLLPDITGLDAAYISFDDPDERLRFRDSTIPALRSLSAKLILLDEIQKAPYVLDGVKYLFDNGETKRSTIILTGSSQILMLKGVQETLAGRLSLFELLPLSMAEVNGTKAEQMLLHQVWNAMEFDLEVAEGMAFAPLDAVREKEAVRDRLLTWGGYPPVVLEVEEDERESWIRNYRRTYVERDILEVGGVGDSDMFIRVQQLLALRTANLISYSDISRDAGCSPHTIRRYLQTLELTFQAFRLRPYWTNIGKRLVKSSKVFFTDMGVLRSLVRSGLPSGAWYETLIFSELMKWRAHSDQNLELLFYRTSSGLEVDFVLEGRHGLLPIEAKSVQQVRPPDARSLSRFLSDYADQTRFGLLIYKGKEVKELAPNVYAVPDWVLLG